MERRIRRIEAAFTPTEAVQLRALSEIAAEDSGIDASLILHEAGQVLARMRAAGPRPLTELAESERIPADEMVEVMTQLRERWQEVG